MPDEDATRRPEPGIATSGPDRSGTIATGGQDRSGTIATIGDLQARAGNRATAVLISRLGRSRHAPLVQRDPLASTADASRLPVDPAGTSPDAESIEGDGESGPVPSDWASTGADEGPMLPATVAGSVTRDEPASPTTGAGTPVGVPGQVEVAGGQATALETGGGAGPGVIPLSGGAAPGSSTGGGSPAPASPPAGPAGWMQRPEGAAVARLLSGSAIGREALQAATHYAVQIDFQAKGRPAAYDAGLNRCYLDPATPAPELATYFVHEMHHARQAQEGLSPLPDKAPDREAWVDLEVNEEVAATWRSFEARVEMGAGGALPSGPLADAWTQYQRVRRTWREKHLEGHPGDTAGADALATAKGRALIRYLIVGDPDSRTLPGLGPDQFSSYAMYYRRQWNIAHNGRP